MTLEFYVDIFNTYPIKVANISLIQNPVAESQS